MTSEDSSQITKSLVSIDTKVLTLVYKDLAKPGVQQVGKALSTVLGLGNTVLLPLKLLNEKAQLLYAKHMEQYRQKLEDIPQDKIIEVAPEIGVPIMENLEKTTNEKISELYINLLTNASNIDFVGDTHPRFVSIVENLTPDEVKILEQAKESAIPFITIMMRVDFKALKKDRQEEAHLLDGINSEFGEVAINYRATMFEREAVLSLPDKAKFYFQNLEGLGLVRAETERFILGPVYEPLLKEFDKTINTNTPHSKQSVEKGSYDLTEFGKLFLRACHTGSESKYESVPLTNRHNSHGQREQ